MYCLQVDEQRLVTGGADRVPRYWDRNTLYHVRCLEPGHEHWVNVLRFDEEKLVTGSEDGSLKLYSFHDEAQCYTPGDVANTEEGELG